MIMSFCTLDGSGGICAICLGYIFGGMYTLGYGTVIGTLGGGRVMARFWPCGEWVGNITTLRIGVNPGGSGS